MGDYKNYYYLLPTTTTTTTTTNNNNNNNYRIKVKRLNVVIEELKQRITAIATTVRRYQERVDSHRQKRLFENNQRQFYRELDREEERCDDDQPVAEETKVLGKHMESVCRP